MRTFSLFLFAGLMLTAPAALAQSVDGVWEGEVEGRKGAQQVTFTFEVDGHTLTGSVETRRGATEITDGKIEGDEISFKTSMSFRDNNITMIYTGKVSGDEIAFTREIEEFGRTSEFTVKRKT